MYIVIDKTSGWADARIIKDKNFKNRIFTDPDTAYKLANEFDDAVVIGDKPEEDSTERVYTKAQLLDFRTLISILDFRTLISILDLVKIYDKHFGLEPELEEGLSKLIKE